MNRYNDRPAELEELDAINSQAEFGIRCEVGTLIGSKADAAAALRHASNSEADADSPEFSQRVFTETGHFQLVADAMSSVTFLPVFVI